MKAAANPAALDLKQAGEEDREHTHKDTDPVREYCEPCLRNCTRALEAELAEYKARLRGDPTDLVGVLLIRAEKAEAELASMRRDRDATAKERNEIEEIAIEAKARVGNVETELASKKCHHSGKLRWLEGFRTYAAQCPDCKMLLDREKGWILAPKFNIGEAEAVER